MNNLSEPYDLKELFDKYNCKPESFVNIQIGCNNRIYILLNENIPPRIDGCFVPTKSDSNYSVIAFTVDWDNECVTGDEYYDLGKHEMNYHFIQPFGEQFLLVGSRCECDDNDIGEKNAAIMGRNGNIIRQFCFGDGIEDCIVRSDNSIITSYFDEGIFGNYGWGNPIGSSGLIVWSSDGKIAWENKRSIYDCYAINIDENENLWYYYYDKFELIRTDLKSEMSYLPGISGADRFAISADGRSAVFDGGYNKHGKLFAIKLETSKAAEPVEFPLEYRGESISVKIFGSLKSQAVFIDGRDRLFVKRFLNL